MAIEVVNRQCRRCWGTGSQATTEWVNQMGPNGNQMVPEQHQRPCTGCGGTGQTTQTVYRSGPVLNPQQNQVFSKRLAQRREQAAARDEARLRVGVDASKFAHRNTQRLQAAIERLTSQVPKPVVRLAMASLALFVFVVTIRCSDPRIMKAPVAFACLFAAATLVAPALLKRIVLGVTHGLLASVYRLSLVARRVVVVTVQLGAVVIGLGVVLAILKAASLMGG